jgi:hypothetical protein
VKREYIAARLPPSKKRKPTSSETAAATRVLALWRRVIDAREALLKQRGTTAKERLDELTIALAALDSNRRGYDALNRWLAPRDVLLRQRLALSAAHQILELIHRGGLTLARVEKTHPGLVQTISACTAPERALTCVARDNFLVTIRRTFGAASEALEDGRGMVNAACEALENLGIAGWSRSSLYRLGGRSVSADRPETGKRTAKTSGSPRKRGVVRGDSEVDDDS